MTLGQSDAPKIEPAPTLFKAEQSSLSTALTAWSVLLILTINVTDYPI